ncbi:MAG: hypothetical protein JKX94_08335 [Sneathiella sp.]|nr:hypothetical protein [Sneathiella sp.]
MVPRFNVRLAAGTGKFPDGEASGGLCSLQQFLVDAYSNGGIGNLAVVEISGDSMEPVIKSGDEVLINLADTSLVDGGLGGRRDFRNHIK